MTEMVPREVQKERSRMHHKCMPIVVAERGHELLCKKFQLADR